MRVFPVPPQTVLLRDGSGVEIGADVYLRTCDPVKATLGVQSLDASVKALAKTTLINACMPLSLGDLSADTQVNRFSEGAEDCFIYSRALNLICL